MSEVAELSPKSLMEADSYAMPLGYKQTDVGVIPEDWDVSPLSRMTSLMTNGFVGTAKTHYTDSHDGVTYIQGYNVEENGFNFNGIKRVTPEFHKKNTKSCLREGDVLMVQTGDVGLVTIVPRELEGANCHALIISRFKKEMYDPQYFSYYLNSQQGRLRLKELETGTTMKHINVGDLLLFEVPYPRAKKEQTAIANALSDVDALISELEKLIAKKQAIKTATMQQLLTGRTRLPQFALREDGSLKDTKPSELGEIPEDWEVVVLKDLLKESPKYGINAPAVPLEGKLPVYIRITDISEDGYFKPTEKVGVKSPFSDLYQLADGDLVLARTGASVGKSYLYRPEDGVLVYAGFLIKVTPEQSKLDPKFLFQYLQTERYWSWVTVNSMRSGQPGINGNEYGSLMLPWPEKEEQAAIAIILSDMDAEIQALEQRLGKTRQIKQGMMQELLTGRVRLISGELKVESGK